MRVDVDSRGHWTDAVLEQVNGRVVWWSFDGAVRHCLDCRLEAAVARARASDPTPAPALALARCRTVHPRDAALPPSARRQLRRVA